MLQSISQLIYISQGDPLFLKYVFRIFNLSYCQWQALLNQVYRCDYKLVHFNIILSLAFFFSSKECLGHLLFHQWFFTKEYQYIIRNRIPSTPIAYRFVDIKLHEGEVLLLATEFIQLCKKIYVLCVNLHSFCFVIFKYGSSSGPFKK